jgi:hypothetical protein
MLESLLVIKGVEDISIDFAEEYLQFLISPGKTSSGSSSYSNIPAMANNGLPLETEFPYIGQEWATVDYSALSKSRCGPIPSTYQPSCLVGHRDTRRIRASDADLLEPTSPYYDPELLTARDSATNLKKRLLGTASKTAKYLTQSQVLDTLNSGLPVLLDIDFYYGAWNHRKGEDWGIKRNMTQWYAGVVTYPEQGSMDRKFSLEDPAGHSVLIVGYDNELVITNTAQMLDGTEKDFTYQGVYIFKNSWGTGSFGEDCEYQGKIYDGYGMITMKYANEFGTYFKMTV